MESIRQKRIAQLIQQEAAAIFTGGTFINTTNALVTVSKVAVTADIGIARIYLSLFNVTEKEAFIQSLRQRTNEIRHLLSQRIRHQVRIIPTIEFYLDDTLDYVFKMEELFKKLK